MRYIQTYIVHAQIVWSHQIDIAGRTSLHHVQSINQSVICVIRGQTFIINTNCRSPQVSNISGLSISETVDGKQIVSNWPAVAIEGRDFKRIHYRSISSAYRVQDYNEISSMDWCSTHNLCSEMR